jgi:Asp-tRNA(Asn)/Glu-tRNA(Gln) amidotransferase A subunit family amidase
MARTAEDVRTLFQVLAGYDSDDPFSAPIAPRVADITGVRVGIMEQFYQVPVQPSVRVAVQKAARTLESIGIPVVPFEPRGLERAPNLWTAFFDELALPFLRDTVRGYESEAHWTTTEFLKACEGKPERSATDVLEWLGARDHMRGNMLPQMSTTPVLLLPVAAVTAFPHRTHRFDTGVREIGIFQAMMTSTPWNLLGLPAMTIPFDRDSDGLPVGVQLVGRPWEEELLLELAVRMEEARGPFPSPPGV